MQPFIRVSSVFCFVTYVAPLSEKRYTSNCALLPAALRATQKRRYISYLEADFEVIRPAGATRCTDGGEIWQGGVEVHSAVPNSPQSVQR